MPQMKPMNWIILYFMLNMILMFLNIMNFYLFLNNLNNNKIYIKNYKFKIWKW